MKLLNLRAELNFELKGKNQISIAKNLFEESLSIDKSNLKMINYNFCQMI